MRRLNKMYNYNTLSEAVHDLQNEDTHDFLIPENKECIHCLASSLELSPEEFVLDEIYRFEEISDPDDESILFAIPSPTHKIKGLVINSFGADFCYRAS